MDTDKINGLLAAPLHVSAIKTRKNFGGGGDLSYIEAHHAIREANRIFGHMGWSREALSCEIVCTSPYKSKQGKDMVAVSYVARVRIIVGSISRDGVGYGDGQATTDRAYSAHELAAKEAESDAMKRALMTFGDPFGLALYEKDKSKANVSTGLKEDARMSKKNSRDLYDVIQKDIDNAPEMGALIEAWKKHWPAIQTIHVDFQDQITQRKDDKKTELEKKAA